MRGLIPVRQLPMKVQGGKKIDNELSQQILERNYGKSSLNKLKNAHLSNRSELGFNDPNLSALVSSTFINKVNLQPTLTTACIKSDRRPMSMMQHNKPAMNISTDQQQNVTHSAYEEVHQKVKKGKHEH